MVYLDTSVIGGCFDVEFKVDSLHLIEQIINGIIIGVVSEITEKEIESAPVEIKDHYDRYRQILYKLKSNSEVEYLADQYLKEEIVSSKFRNDCLHIAFGTVFEVDILVSWNFRHIVNYNKINKFNALNLKNGYKSLQIYSPSEVLYKV